MATTDADKSVNVAGALEALLLLVTEPVTEFELAQAVGVPESVVAETLAELVAFYEETGRGFELRQVVDGVVEEQVLRAGLRIGVLPRLAGVRDVFQRLLRR